MPKIKLDTVLRRLHIFARIIRDGFTTTRRLSEEYGERKETIIRDIDYWLELMPQFIHSDRDIVSFLPYSPTDDRLIRRFHSCLDEKMEIAKYVVGNLIHAGDRIFLYGASTAFFIARELVNQKFHNLTIFTNNLFLLNLLNNTMSDVRIIGGRLPQNHSMIAPSPDIDHEIERAEIQKAFIGFDGVVFPDGLFTSARWAPAYKALNQHTKTLLCFLGDHTKFGKTPREKVLSFDEINKVISKDKKYIFVADDHIDDESMRKEFEQEISKFPAENIKLVSFDKKGG